MTKTDLATFRELLRSKQIELSGKSLSLERIAIERSADELEEAEYKSLREMAIAGLNRESAMRRSIELALRRITDRSFGVCVHCGRRSQEAPSGGSAPGPHSASAVRKRPIAATRVFSKAPSRRCSTQLSPSDPPPRHLELTRKEPFRTHARFQQYRNEFRRRHCAHRTLTW